VTTAPGPRRPHSADVWDVRETWPVERIREHQLQQLQCQLRYVAESSAFFAGRWKSLDFEPADIKSLEDLSQLPTVAKPDYLASLEDSPPWGSGVAVDLRRAARVHFSSGTTSAPTPVLWSHADLERWSDLYARTAYAQGVRDSDIYQCLFSYSWFVGGLGATNGYAHLGATVIPGGSSDTKRQIDTLFRFGTTAVGGTPSFMVHMAEVAQEMGLDLRDSQVRTIMTGGEPGAAVPGTRTMIEQLWGAKAYDGYGSLEFQPIAWECTEQAGGHLAEDFLYAEVVDPDTKDAVPDGTPGVLVLTHLDKQAVPLVRWWTGDVVVRDPSPCSCGRTHARLPGGVRGRSDDMIVVRGVNVFPSAIEDVVRRQPGSTGEYVVVLDDDVVDPDTGFPHAIKVRAEVRPEARDGFAERLAAAVREQTKVRAVVESVDPGALPRHTHKAQRLIRQR
jgi:phenylacetate-CoA ligase